MVSNETKLGLFLGLIIVGGILVSKFIMGGGLDFNKVKTINYDTNPKTKRVYYDDGTWTLFERNSNDSGWDRIEFGTWDQNQPVPE